MNRVAVFADVQNIYYTVKQKYHCHFDYGAFLEQAMSGRSLVKAISYATDKGDRKQIDFQQILRRMGFEIKLTPFLQRRDGSAKGDWDVGIALDMIEYAKRVDTIILASGDGDFSVVNFVQTRIWCVVSFGGVRSPQRISLCRYRTLPIEIQHLLLTIRILGNHSPPVPSLTGKIQGNYCL
jgi:NYN domain